MPLKWPRIFHECSTQCLHYTKLQNFTQAACQATCYASYLLWSAVSWTDRSISVLFNTYTVSHVKAKWSTTRQRWQRSTTSCWEATSRNNNHCVVCTENYQRAKLMNPGVRDVDLPKWSKTICTSCEDVKSFCVYRVASKSSDVMIFEINIETRFFFLKSNLLHTECHICCL